MTTWRQRRRARRRLKDWVGLRYHPQYRVEKLGETARVPGVEVARGEKILGSLGAAGLIGPKQVRPAPLVALADLAKVHSDAYLAKTAQPEYLGRIFGLEAHDVEVDPVLIAQRRQVGGTAEAAMWAVRRSDRVAFNIGGGFHHAEPEAGGGFCVYNDIAVAIAVLREDGFDAPIAIVDLDYHQGNGNIVTYEHDETVFTYSIHGSVWSHVEAAADSQFLLPSEVDDEAYMKVLRDTLTAALERIVPKLIFYVSGNDVLAEDRLGEFMLTRKGVLERDCFVIELARQHGCPVVVTLGGGYSDDAWRSSTDFIRWLLTDEAAITEEPKKSLFEQYTQIAQELDPYDLQRPSGDFTITEEDLYGDLTGSRAHSTRILDYYSRHGLEFAIEKYGLAETIRARGFTDLRLDIDPADPERQHLTVHAKKDGEEHLLVDQVLRRVKRPAPEGLEPPDDLTFLYIEWMMLQNPTANFSLRNRSGQDRTTQGSASVNQRCTCFFKARSVSGSTDWRTTRRATTSHSSGAGNRFLGPEAPGPLRSDPRGARPARPQRSRLEDGARRGVLGDGERIEWIPEDIVIPASERFFAYLDHGTTKNRAPPRSKQRARVASCSSLLSARRRQRARPE